jgi:hypothetical protein
VLGLPSICIYLSKFWRSFLSPSLGSKHYTGLSTLKKSVFYVDKREWGTSLWEEWWSGQWHKQMEAASIWELSAATCQCTRYLIPENLNLHKYRCVTSDVALGAYPWSEIKFSWRTIFVNKESTLSEIMSREIRLWDVQTEFSTEKQILAPTNLKIVAK